MLNQHSFPNEYPRASITLRQAIDRSQAASNLHSAALGILSLTGRNNRGILVTHHFLLGDNFDEFGFVVAHRAFTDIELMVLLVVDENVFPPLSALEAIQQRSPKCEVLRVRAAGLKFECRSISKIIELAQAEAETRALDKVPVNSADAVKAKVLEAEAEAAAA